MEKAASNAMTYALTHARKKNIKESYMAICLFFLWQLYPK